MLQTHRRPAAQEAAILFKVLLEDSDTEAGMITLSWLKFVLIGICIWIVAYNSGWHKGFDECKEINKRVKRWAESMFGHSK